MKKYFRVSVNFFGPAGEGFVDDKKIEDYGIPTVTPVQSLTKERANMRYERIIHEVTENATIEKISSITKPSASATANATSFAFTLVFDREQPHYTRNELFGTAHPSGTMEILYDEDAVKRQVARAFVYNLTGSRDYYDSTGSVVPSDAIKDTEVVASELVVGANLSAKITSAESNITVTVVANT